jgi:hypothetical protein
VKSSTAAKNTTRDVVSAEVRYRSRAQQFVAAAEGMQLDAAQWTTAVLLELATALAWYNLCLARQTE